MQEAANIFDLELETVGSTWENMEEGLRASERLERAGSVAAARDRRLAIWNEYVRMSDLLQVYTGSKSLGDRLIEALARVDAQCLAEGGAVSAQMEPAAALAA